MKTAEIKTTNPAKNYIQTKCDRCEQEEKLQMREDDELLDNEMNMQTKFMDTPSDLQSLLNSAKGGGHSMSSEATCSECGQIEEGILECFYVREEWLE